MNLLKTIVSKIKEWLAVREVLKAEKELSVSGNLNDL